MCNPLAIGAVLMAAGTAAQYQGNKRAEKAAVNVRRAEDSRQNMFKEQAEGGLRKNMDAASAEAIEGQQAASAKSRSEGYSNASMQAPQLAQMVSSGALGGNQVVQDSLAGALGRANANAAQLGEARSRLNSFGDAMFNTNVQLGRGREEIGTAGDFAKRSAEATGMELQAAAHRGDKLKMLGTLLTAVGGAAMGGAGAAGGAGAGAGASATAAGTASSGMIGALGAGLGPMLSAFGSGGGNSYLTGYSQPSWLQQGGSPYVQAR